jgi:hypothetical protein
VFFYVNDRAQGSTNSADFQNLKKQIKPIFSTVTRFIFCQKKQSGFIKTDRFSKSNQIDFIKNQTDFINF